MSEASTFAPFPHWSPSKGKLYRQCPRKFWYRYFTDEPTRKSPSLIIGTAADEALQLGLVQLRTSHDFDLGMVEQEFTKSLNNGTSGVHLSDEELIELAEGSANVKRGFDPYLKYVKNRFMEILPPQIAIKDWYLDKSMELPMLGYIDMVGIDHDGEFVIIDHKTKKKADAQPDDKFQLLTYGIWFCEEYGLKMIPRSELHIFLKQSPKRNPEKVFEIKEVFFSQAQVSKLREDYMQLEEAVRKEFFPANRWHHLCNRKFCDYYELCSKS